LFLVAMRHSSFHLIVFFSIFIFHFSQVGNFCDQLCHIWWHLKNSVWVNSCKVVNTLCSTQRATNLNHLWTVRQITCQERMKIKYFKPNIVYRVSYRTQFRRLKEILSFPVKRMLFFCIILKSSIVWHQCLGSDLTLFYKCHTVEGSEYSY
jgi:hypothetical protein